MERTLYLDLIKHYFQVHPVCAILGARQVGKTTLARQFAQQHPEKKVVFFDLENPAHIASLENPMTTLSAYADSLVVIDEIQRRADLFPILRVLVDDPVKKYTFLILGSASRDLIRQSSETLAGRIGYIELPPFTLLEVDDSYTLLARGGFPRSYLAPSEEHSLLWRQEYITTFLERDIPSFGFDVPPQVMHRFWMMLCFYHGQIFNASELARSLMISDKTVKNYLDILAGTFMIRVLQPWFENIRKRQTKTPKIYFRDSGIFNALSSISSLDELMKTPKVGPLWEGFALEEIINCFRLRSDDCYFWSTHTDAELDLLVFAKGKRIGFEFKYSDAPKITKSMHIALEDLKLDHLYIIFPGKTRFVMQEKITACGLEVLSELKI
ncbi:MAG TPA: ATP-binding protein [Candidatus Limnocylindria bacterium]|nr:ATP-binding protein [Candidatus Limnocylindria bacterium]